MTATDPLEIRIWRGEALGLVRYQVPRQANQTVLDVVTWVQRNLAPDLAYRYACRVGMCGSCAMVVNGVPRWTCRTQAEAVAEGGTLEIRPLRNLPVVKDLVTDMTRFFDNWRDADGKFHGTEREGFSVIRSDEPRRQAASAGIECIGCGVCFSACDTVVRDKSFLGPAALNRAWTCVNDDREPQPARHLRAVAERALQSHSQGSCARHCPVGLNPTRSIAGLKRALAVAALKGEL